MSLDFNSVPMHTNVKDYIDLGDATIVPSAKHRDNNPESLFMEITDVDEEDNVIEVSHPNPPKPQKKRAPKKMKKSSAQENPKTSGYLQTAGDVMPFTAPLTPDPFRSMYEESLRRAVEEKMQQAIRDKAAKEPPTKIADPTMPIEFRGDFGTIRSFYHDIVVQEELLILVMDSRYTGARYTPPGNSNGVPLKINLNGKTIQAINFGMSFVLSKYNLDIAIFIIGEDND